VLRRYGQRIAVGYRGSAGRLLRHPQVRGSDGSTCGLGRRAEAAARSARRLAILGNHDWWYDVNGVRKALGEVSIPLLENQAVHLGEEGNRFWLAGLGDQIAHRISRNQFRGEDDLPGTLARVRTDDPILLLVHEPDIFPRVPDKVALTLAGHTHGGQIRLPLLWPSFVPSAYGARYAYDHIAEDRRQMVVSGGLGTSIVPLRLGVPPEIVHVEVRGPIGGSANSRAS